MTEKENRIIKVQVVFANGEALGEALCDRSKLTAVARGDSDEVLDLVCT